MQGGYTTCLKKLKELGYIEYDDTVYTLKLYYYPDGGMGLEVYDDKGAELLHQDSVRSDTAPIRVETRTTFPHEHIDEEK